MKKLNLFLVGIFALTFAACNHNDPETKVKINDDAIKLDVAEATFYGTRFTQTDVNEIQLEFYTKGMTFEDGYITSAGQYLSCDLYIGTASLSDGTFVLGTTSTSGSVGTMDPEYTFYYNVVETDEGLDGVQGTVNQVIVQATDKGFTVVMDIIDANNNAIQAYYEGQIDISDASQGGDDDDEDEDLDEYPYEDTTPTTSRPTYEIADATNTGSWEDDGTDCIYLELFDKDTLQYTLFELYVKSGLNELPAGEYKAAESGEFTWLPGYMFWGILPAGSYADNMIGDEETVYWWETGTLKVVKNADDTYTISTNDIKSHYGSTLEFTYTGPVNYTVEEYDEEGDYDDDDFNFFAPRRLIKSQTSHASHASHASQASQTSHTFQASHTSHRTTHHTRTIRTTHALHSTTTHRTFRTLR